MFGRENHNLTLFVRPRQTKRIRMFTNKLPSKPGFYLMKCGTGKKPKIMEVNIDARQRLVIGVTEEFETDGIVEPLEIYDDSLWFGPIVDIAFSDGESTAAFNLEGFSKYRSIGIELM